MLYTYSCALMPSTFVYGSICVPLICPHLCVKSMKVFCLSTWPGLYPFACLRTIRPFTFSEKSDCTKINLVLSAVSIITILVKLLQMIFCYVTSFVVSVCLSLCPCLQKTFISRLHIIMAVRHIHLILVRPRVPVTGAGLLKEGKG